MLQFKSKQFSLLRASFKGMSSVGLTHPSHAKVVEDVFRERWSVWNGSWTKCLVWEQGSVWRGQELHHPQLSFCCLSLEPCDFERDLRTAGILVVVFSVVPFLPRAQPPVCPGEAAVTLQGLSPGAHGAKQKFTPSNSR